MSDLITIKPGDKYASIRNPRMYRALRRRGYSKESAAKITNARSKSVGDLGRAVEQSQPQYMIDAIATQCGDLPRFKGEQIAPGITRIRGNLCNVHGRYGKCPGASAAPVKPPAKPKKGGRARKPAKPPKGKDPAAVARQEQRDREHAEDRAHTLQRREEVAADRQARLARQAERDRERLAKLNAPKPEKQPKGGGGGGGKGKQPPAAKPAKQQDTRAQIVRDAAQRARQQAQDAARAAREQATLERSRVTTPALANAARQLSDGQALSVTEADALVRNGLARRDRDGNLTLTATGLRATRQKSFHVYKQANGAYRWVAFSSNAYRDRDKEIVSTKALADDCARADQDGAYGPLRWWHVPGVELGTCDFNAMHGRILVESGTFKDARIGARIAAKADQLQLSIGFVHPLQVVITPG